MKNMTNRNRILAQKVKSATLVVFKADLEKRIIDTPQKPGTVMELAGARVFEAVAREKGLSGGVRELGNSCDWKMTGLEAAVELAAYRLWACPEFSGMEFDDVLKLVV